MVTAQIDRWYLRGDIPGLVPICGPIVSFTEKTYCKAEEKCVEEAVAFHEAQLRIWASNRSISVLISAETGSNGERVLPP